MLLPRDGCAGRVSGGGYGDLRGGARSGYPPALAGWNRVFRRGEPSPVATAISPEPAPGAAHSAYPPPAAAPTQEGPRGIRFDFNLGCRVTVPEGDWHVRLSDLDTGNILFEKDTASSFVNSTKRHFVRFRI